MFGIDRRIFFTAVALVGAGTLAACATDDRFGAAKFDRRDVSSSKSSGGNVISGTARLTSTGNTTKTCASLPVRLAPDTNYTRDRISRLYGDGDEGFVDARRAKDLRTQQVASIDKNYERSLMASVCDHQGRFTFRNLPDGTYYLLAPVVWRNSLGAVTEGGFFMQRIKVTGGETKRVVLASR
jgi:hypothetical protein